MDVEPRLFGISTPPSTRRPIVAIKIPTVGAREIRAAFASIPNLEFFAVVECISRFALPKRRLHF